MSLLHAHVKCRKALAIFCSKQFDAPILGQGVEMALQLPQVFGKTTVHQMPYDSGIDILGLDACVQCPAGTGTARNGSACLRIPLGADINHGPAPGFRIIKTRPLLLGKIGRYRLHFKGLHTARLAARARRGDVGIEELHHVEWLAILMFDPQPEIHHVVGRLDQHQPGRLMFVFHRRKLVGKELPKSGIVDQVRFRCLRLQCLTGLLDVRRHIVGDFSRTPEFSVVEFDVRIPRLLLLLVGRQVPAKDFFHGVVEGRLPVKEFGPTTLGGLIGKLLEHGGQARILTQFS